jgi:RHS repeat-associated protein
MTSHACGSIREDRTETRLRWFLLVAAALLGMALPSRAAAQSITVNPFSGSQQALANTAGQTAAFSVTNNSGVSQVINLNPCSRSGAVTSCSSPASVFVQQAMTAPVNVTFATGAPGSGTLHLQLASGASTAFIAVTVIAGNSVTVTPDGTTAPMRTPNTGGYSAAFTVTNTGTSSNTLSFSCVGATGVTCGTLPGPVTLAAGAPTTVNMPYSVGAAGTGTLSLTASGGGASDGGSYSVPIGGLIVTPVSAVAVTRQPNTGGYGESFTIQNLGVSNTFTFSCNGVGGVICGTVPAAVTLATNAQVTRTMPYSTGTAGTGTLSLSASGGGMSATGNYTVPIVSSGVAVTPDGATATMRLPNTGGHSESFVVQNTGGASNTYSFTCAGATGVTCGTLPTAVTLSAGAQTNVSMPYSVGAAGTGTLTLTATGTGASNPGSYSVPIGGLVVTPLTAMAANRLTNTGGYSESFTIQNLGVSNLFTFACNGVGGVVCGALPAPITLATNAQVTRTMPYSVGAVGTGTLTVSVSGGGMSASGNYTVPIVAGLVEVTPDAGVEPDRISNSSGYSAIFVVRNAGGPSNTYSFTCVGATGVTCGPNPAAVTLGPGAQTNVTMQYGVGAAGTGMLTLTATGTGAPDAGSYSVTIVPGGVPVILSYVDANGSFTKDSRFLLQETANTYDADGRITQRTNARGGVTNYGYGGNVTNAFPTKVTDVRDAASPIDLVTDITYDTDGLVASIKDPGGSFRYFLYDPLGRLRRIMSPADTVVKAYGYTYSRTSTNGWVFQPSSPNTVVDSTFVALTPALNVAVTTSYVDGLGETVQAVVQDGSNYHVSATQYDPMGRLWRVWKPYTRTAAGYDPSFAINAANFYTSYHGTTATPYVETRYRPDGLDRVSRVIPEYLGTTPAVWMTTNYGVDATAKQDITEVVDEAGKKSRSYADVFGNSIRSILGYGATEAATTTSIYNVLGQRTQATDPRGLNINYTIDTRGLLTTKVNPDAGTLNSMFDRAGNLRFSQDAKQTAAGQVYFVNYDFAGRGLTSGVGTWAFSSLNPDAAPTALETASGNWLAVRAYDATPATATLPWSLFSSQITSLSLANVAGRLAAVASKSGSAWQVTLFSYDTHGQVAKRYTYTQNNAGSSVLTAVNTTAGYFRDLRGALTRRELTVGSNTFYQWYDYDNRGLLSKLYASTSATKPATADVTDTYGPDGKPQGYQFQGGPLVPIRYTIRGQTALVGDPAATTYPFSARYTYNPNGTVLESEFRSSGSSAPDKRYRYVFPTYDALNRLNTANFSIFTASAWTATAAYDLTGISYDASGNITALKRYRQAATVIDNLTYTYPGTSNRLSSVSDAIATTSETWDAEDGSFTYDPNGNIATAPAPYSITATSYNQQNLPISLTRAGVTTKYRYDDAGQRIIKQVGTGNIEVYLREGATTLGVVTVNASGTPTSWYFNLVWESRIVGRQPNTGSRSYYHTDVLGSARAVVQGTTVVESYDYDPWGLLLEGRTLGSGTKEQFGAKERDSETGLTYFGARYYMPALGRWAAVDPATDGMPAWSPYNYVYDNPAMNTDPDGRQVVELVQTLVTEHPEFAKGIGRGVVANLAGSVHAITHFGETLKGIGRLAAAATGDPAATMQLAQGFAAGLESAKAKWQSGEGGRGELLGEVLGTVLVTAVTAGGAEAATAARAARAVEVVGGVATGLPDAALVARGGGLANQTAARINSAIGPSRTPGITGFSAQCNGGTCISELGRFLRNKELGVTTVGEIRQIGGDVIATPGVGHHVTVTGVSGEAVSPLLRIVENPHPLDVP